MKLQSHSIPSSNTFQTNRKGHLEALGVISDAAALATAGGGERLHDRARVDGVDAWAVAA